MSVKKWIGTPPKSCDVCHDSIKLEFYDAKLLGGPWAITCPLCFVMYGSGLGEGKGQRYRKANGNEYIKVGG